MTYINRPDLNQLADTLEFMYDCIHYLTHPDSQELPSYQALTDSNIATFNNNFFRLLRLLRTLKKGS